MIECRASRITIPSDFKLKVVRMTDNIGNVLNPLTTFVHVRFSVGANEYDCISDPVGGHHVNTVIRNGFLYMIFQHYPFGEGMLQYREHVRVADDMYADGYEDVWSELQTLKVRLAR